ncbi:MAG: 16S rRNA (adenine(1518)-N(6)/adenine(1519)-N(6))-dimethyltransferase RsmA [Thermoplasmata archaeon]|nr:16S rRNA (adenine(1518)-N(6)/adenine(1519)-N(6))-dimethyltransferase RsmA [Thermoplasmata archaeon]
MRLGQHFLADREVAVRQVGYADVGPEDTVLEIGPGTGVLTREIAARAGRVVAIEIDPSLAERVREAVPSAEVIVGDALAVDLPQFDKVVSNLPYLISSDITFRLLQRDFEIGILMYQREFAQRLVSTGGRGVSRLTVNAALRAECTLLEYVPRTAFRPVPRVDSAIVEVMPRPSEFDVDPDFLDRFLRAVFSARRKVMANTVSREFNLPREDVEAMLPVPGCRVDELDVDEVLAFVEALQRERG